MGSHVRARKQASHEGVGEQSFFGAVCGHDAVQHVFKTLSFFGIVSIHI